MLIRSLPESGCKGTTIFRTTKTFRGKFLVFSEKNSRLDKYQASKWGYTLLYIYIRDCSFFTNKGLLAFLRSLTDEVHELVEFRSDDNLGATVAHLTNLTGIRLERIVLTKPVRHLKHADKRGPSCCGCSHERWAHYRYYPR